MLLTALYAIGPVGLKGVALLLVWSFPLGKSEQAEIRRQIDLRQRAHAQES